MNRILLTLAAVATIAGPLALSAGPVDAQPRHDRRADDHRGNRGDRGERAGWDRGRHNGYYYRDHWYYGPPPQAYYGNPSYRPGYAAWRRGGTLPGYYRTYRVNDYYRYHLRPPPRGYAWYRVGDDYLLTAITTGLIFDIIGD